MVKGLFIFSVFLFLIVQKIRTQELLDVHKQLSFNYLTINEGLSSNEIKAICGDKDGFVWIGGRNGLNRFDGYIIDVFKNIPNDSSSINDNGILSLLYSSKGQLWVGTRSGVNKYKEMENHFYRLQCNVGTSVSMVEDLTEGEDGRIWVCAKEGLYYFNQSGLEPVISEFNILNASYKNIRAVYEDKSDSVWIGTRDNGFFIVNKKTHKIIPIPPCDDKLTYEINNSDVQGFYKDIHGDLFIYTNQFGMFIYDRDKRTVSKVIIDTENSLSKSIRDIEVDKWNRMWVATKAGIYVKGARTNIFTHYSHVDQLYSKLNYNSTLDLYIDKRDLLWVATYAGGVNYANLNQKNFKKILSSNTEKGYLNDEIVHSIYLDKNDGLWIGTEWGGLNYLNRKTGKLKYFTNDPQNDKSISSNNIKAIFPDKKDNLWIGTHRGGVVYFDLLSQTFKRYMIKPEEPSSIVSNNIVDVLVDKKGDLWVATEKGVELKKKNENFFRHFQNDAGEKFGLGRIFTTRLFQDNNNNIWLGTWGNGLYMFKEEDSTFVSVYKEIKGGINSFCQDKLNQIWITTTSGLYCVSNGKIICNYIEQDGLPTSFLCKVLDDQIGNIWVSTLMGLVKFVNGVNTPQSPDFIIYKKGDGLPSNQFRVNTNFKSHTGEMFFGTNNGLVYFWPNEILSSSFAPKIKITGLRVFNKKVKVNEEVKGDVILHKSINHSDKITLSHKHLVFSIEFVSLFMVNANDCKYAYKLEGFDEAWNYTNAENRLATYTNLEGGDYVFKVKSTNLDGRWAENQVELKIKIKPPFYKTLGFKIFMGIAFVVFGFLINIIRIRNLKAQKKKLGLKVEQKANELKGRHKEIEEKNAELTMAYQDIKMFSEIGKQLTSKLRFDKVIEMVYNFVLTLTNVSGISVGNYDEGDDRIIFNTKIENHKFLKGFVKYLNDVNSCSVWCYNHKTPIFSNNIQKDYTLYVNKPDHEEFGEGQSVAVLPLLIEKNVIGMVILYSDVKDAFTQRHFDLLLSLSSYIAISLYNSNAYKGIEDKNLLLSSQAEALNNSNAQLEETQMQLEEQSEELQAQKEELETHRNNLQSLVQERTQELDGALKKAEESEKLKASFLANISHEVRTPIHVIVGFSKLIIKAGINKEKRERYVKSLIQNTEYLLGLIENIIDISRLEIGQAKLQKSSYSCKKLIYDVYQTGLLQGSYYEKEDISILVEEELEDCEIYSDIEKVHQILVNFVSNAINYTETGFVKIGYNLPQGLGDVVELYVKDTGIGIEKEKMDFIFDRFTKVEKERSKMYRGTGIGLYLCKKLADLLNSKIRVESEPGKGSVFYLDVITNKEKQVMFEDEITYDDSQYDWTGKKILVAEDETANFEFISELLSETGVDIIRAKDGVEVVSLCESNNGFDLILMDMRMPNMDGVEATKIVTSKYTGMPVLALTAYAQAEQKNEMMEAGCIGIIEKPFKIDQVFKKLDEFLNRG